MWRELQYLNGLALAMGSILERNYFDLFGLPAEFDIDPDDLNNRYRALQRSVHPDRHAAAGDRARRISLQHAARVNEAHQVLRSSLPRARYLLQLKGVDVDTHNNASLPAEFLMEQMELREALEELPEADDPLAEIGRFMERVGHETERRTKELARSLAQATDASLEHASNLLLELHFYKRLEEQAAELEGELEDELR